MSAKSMREAFGQILPNFSMDPFSGILQPHIDEVLREQGLSKFRKGTILRPKLLMWLILMLTIRRDLCYNKALSWMVSGFRWIKKILPAKSQILKDGAISKARRKLGVEPLRALFYKLKASFASLPKDFYEWTSVTLDGTTATMPDTKENNAHFKKPSSRKGSSGFPQIRIMSLIINPLRIILDIEWAPYSGKKTGERTLMMKILERLVGGGFLFLLDAGLYSASALWQIKQKGQDFIAKAPISVKLKAIKYLPDGSYLAILTTKILDLEAPRRCDGKKSWKTVSITVRVIQFEIPGFRPVRLVSTILYETISAREIALHYHNRWEIEITYDEIKTHQCATLRGQLATTFRSKRPDLVQQELYATIIMYNVVRLLIWRAAKKHAKEPHLISFLDTLQHIIDAAPIMTAQSQEERQDGFSYLLELIADSEIERPRRPRLKRVVKVKMSKFRRKNKQDKSQKRVLSQELTILPPPLAKLSLKTQPESISMQTDSPGRVKGKIIPLKKAA